MCIDFADVQGAVGADGDAEGIGGGQHDFKQQRGEHGGASVADGLARLKSGLEEAEQFGLEGHPEAGDLFAIFVDGVDGFGGDVHVGLGVDAAGNGQPDEFEFGMAFEAGFGVAAGRNDAAFHGADAGVEVEGGGESLGGVVLLRNVGQESAGVEEDAVAADG